VKSSCWATANVQGNGRLGVRLAPSKERIRISLLSVSGVAGNLLPSPVGLCDMEWEIGQLGPME